MEGPTQNLAKRTLMERLGGKTKSALEIMEKVESVGGYINAYTSEEVTAYWVRLLSEDLPMFWYLLLR